MIEVVHPGVYTTVQDLGRPGKYALGLPPAGALDQYSARVANLLVGNPEGAALLEATYQGPKLHFASPARVAVTGAEITVDVDGREHPTWASVEVPAGGRLSFGPMTAGARIYVALGGGLDVPVEIGSRATYTAIGIGGVEGRPLRKHDRLAVGTPPAMHGSVAVPRELQAPVSGTARLRVVMGPHDRLLEPGSVSELLESEWTATPAANRVGYRFSGPKLKFRVRTAPFGAGSDPSNVVDGCYPIGALQAPAGEELIVLLNDGVTAGGYAILGAVISADRDRIAHVKPGEQVRFEAVDLDAAAAARRNRSTTLERVRAFVQESLSG